MKSWILKLLGTLGIFLQAVFKRGISDQLNAILPLALEAVIRVAADASPLSSEEKRTTALDDLAGRIRSKAIIAGASTLNFALELAYQQYKAELGE